MATELCEAEEVLVPKDSFFQETCPYHHLVHLDRSGIYRVDSRCESTGKMKHKPWFTLPPVQEYFYARYHPGYRKLPPWRADCEAATAENRFSRVMNLLYPTKGTAVYVPIDINGNRSRVVFKAVHREPETAIFWHLDEEYIGRTQVFHHMELCPGPGDHLLILIDEKGSRLERRFRVLSKN